MKKLKSFYTNSQDKYTTWGLVCNWAITIVPFIIVGISLWVAKSLDGKTIDTSNPKTSLSSTEAIPVVIWFLVFVFLLYLIIYKLVRLAFKPKKVRDRNSKDFLKPSRAERRRNENEARSKKDKYWGN